MRNQTKKAEKYLVKHDIRDFIVYRLPRSLSTKSETTIRVQKALKEVVSLFEQERLHHHVQVCGNTDVIWKKIKCNTSNPTLSCLQGKKKKLLSCIRELSCYILSHIE